MDAADAALRNALGVVYGLSGQLERMSPWIDADTDSATWECVGLLHSLGGNLAVARGLIAAGAECAETYAGAVLDAGVFGRGLLYQAIDLCVQVGALDDEADVHHWRNRLTAHDLGFTSIVIAYLDYLGATDEWGPHVVEQFSEFRRLLAGGLPRFRRRCYYWTTSDTFCVFGTLNDEDVEAQVREFVMDVVGVQQTLRLDPTHTGWRWQIGVATGTARVLGDVVLPSADSVRAATLMKMAYAKNKGGGSVLCDAQILKGTGHETLHSLLTADGSVLACSIAFDDKKGAYEVRESPREQTAGEG